MMSIELTLRQNALPAIAATTDRTGAPMNRVSHVTRIGLLLLVAAALGACGNLQAVREFSKQSADLRRTRRSLTR